MRAAFDDAAVVHHANHIGPLYRRKPMRDDESGAISCKPGKRFLHKFLALGVERACCLVEQ